MATLPSCMYWTFTNSGLLIQDWLLKPVRPINLNDAINQYYLSSIIDTKNQFSNTIEKLNENKTTTTTTNHHNDNNIQQIIQIMFYFSLPLLPAITMLLSMINIFIEFKYYIYSKYLLYIRPYIYRLPHYLIVFYILTCINSFIIWLIILPRYIPMSIGYYNLLTNELHWNDTSIYMNISSSSSSSSNNNNNHTPKYLTQLPAILTMQIALRLTICWLIIGLLINRIYILNELYINPLKKSFGYYINYLYTLIKENLYDDHCYNHNTTTNNSNNGTLLNDRSNTNKQHNHPLNSIFQYLFKFGANLCSIKKCPIKSCPICKQLNYNWSEEYLCFKCKPNYYHNNTNLLNHQLIIKNNQKNNPIYLSSIINMKRINYKTIGYLILIISLLITCLLLICLPQIWSYQLIGINLKIKLFNQYTTSTTTNTEHMSSISSSNHENYYPAWRLLNKTSQTIYEYCFAVIHFVIPCCTIIVTILLLIIRIIKIKYELKSIILHNINMNKKDIKLYMNIIQYCIVYLIQDSVLILMMGIIQLCCTIPYLMINSIHRLECLLINNQSINGFMPTSSSTSSAGATAAAAGTSKDDLFWPTRQNWLFIEMNYLFGDFLIQLIILSINLCDTNHLLIRNYSIENFQKIYLSNVNRNKQNYHRIQCQMNDVMKFQEMEDHQDTQQRDNDDDDNDGSDDDDDDDDGEDDHHHHDIDEDDNDDNLHDDMNIENGVRKKIYTYRMKTPTDSGQTSKNISPLPISHTISDVLLSPKFRSKQTIYRLNQQNRIHRSIPSALPSPLLQRIPEMINYDTSHHHNYHHHQQQQRNNNCNSFTTKYPTNSYVEPKTNMASLTYSPRSRHPCRLQNKILLHDSSKTINNNNSTSIHMSNPSSLIQSTKLITTPNMNLTRIQQNRQIRNKSPPPLPPPPKHLIQMLGGDSSIYSTPHGSPQQVNTHKLMIINNSNSNTPNNNNISVDYSPDLLHVSSISKHESSTTGSFRQTDSGVTNMGGSVIDSEQYEPNTIVT